VIDCMKCGTEFEEDFMGGSNCPSCGTLHTYDQGFFPEDIEEVYKKYFKDMNAQSQGPDKSS